jgi:hypothetical protein
MKEKILDIKYTITALLCGMSFALSIHGIEEFNNGFYHYISFGLIGLSFLILKTIK